MARRCRSRARNTNRNSSGSSRVPNTRSRTRPTVRQKFSTSRRARQPRAPGKSGVRRTPRTVKRALFRYTRRTRRRSFEPPGSTGPGRSRRRSGQRGGLFARDDKTRSRPVRRCRIPRDRGDKNGVANDYRLREGPSTGDVELPDVSLEDDPDSLPLQEYYTWNVREDNKESSVGTLSEPSETVLPPTQSPRDHHPVDPARRVLSECVRPRSAAPAGDLVLYTESFGNNTQPCCWLAHA